MVNDENSLVPAGTSVHRLEGKALKQWWQIPSAGPIWSPRWSRKRDGRETNAYANAGMQQLLVSILTIPIFVIAKYQNVGASRLDVLAITLWLGLCLLLMSFFRRHRYHVLAVTASETGLELRSPCLKRNIRWLDMADCFPAGTIEPKEFLLQCKTGEEFLLSKDLTDSARLFDLIALRMAQPEVTYELNHRVQDGTFDIVRACAATTIGVFIIWPIADWSLDAGHQFTVAPANLLFMILITVLSLGWYWLNLIKTPQLIRAGRSGLYIRTGRESKVIEWDQITEIRQVAGLIIVNSRIGWFSMFAGKKQPLTERLIDYKKKLLMFNQ